MFVRAILLSILSIWSLHSHAAETIQTEETTCAPASVDFAQQDPGMQFRIVSSVSSTTGYTSSVTLIHKGRELRIGKEDLPKIFSMDKAPRSFRVHWRARKGNLILQTQSTISRGNAAVIVRKATLDMNDGKPQELLCFYSFY